MKVLAYSLHNDGSVVYVLVHFIIMCCLLPVLFDSVAA